MLKYKIMSEETKKKDENKPLEDTRDDSTESEVIEFEFNEDGEEDLKKTLKKLREDLKVCKKEKEEYLTGWQKERADFANYKKAEDDRKAMLSEANRWDFFTRILTCLNRFNMAFTNK